jgi:hypothetical protein
MGGINESLDNYRMANRCLYSNLDYERIFRGRMKTLNEAWVNWEGRQKGVWTGEQAALAYEMFQAGYDSRDEDIQGLVELIVDAWKAGHEACGKIIPRLGGLEEWAKEQHVYELIKEHI